MEKVKKFIIENNLIEYNDKIVVGLSGGPDSVYLINVLNDIKEEYNLDIVAVHINHSIREKEAKRDEEFSKKLANKMDIDFFSFKEDVPKFAKENSLSTEDAGRQIRYNSFNKIANSLKGNVKIAVGHHKDDLVETILMNLLRGSGNNGLIGIQERNGNIIRPILCLEKCEILHFLNDNNIEYVEDHTNFENDYRRNRIRNELIPYIKENFNENIVSNLTNMSNIIKEEQKFINRYTDDLNIFKFENNNINIPLDDFKSLDRAIKRNIVIKAYEILNGSKKDLSFDNIENIISLENKNNASFEIKNYRIYNYNGNLIFSKRKECVNMEKIKLSLGENYYNDYKITVKLVENKNLIFKRNISYYSKEVLKDDLFIRSRINGDTILLENFKKKIKDILIDAKVDKYERDSIPILEQNNNILWIMGIRRSTLYKFNKEDKEILKISFERIDNE